MASGTNYSQEYGQAEKAYLESNFAQAAEIIDHLADEFPDDPNVLLLRGHIYCYGFQNYDVAKQHYEDVLSLSDASDLLDFARSGIEQIEQLQEQLLESDESFDSDNLDYESDLSDIDFPDEQAYEEGFEGDNFAEHQNYEVELEVDLEDAAVDSDINQGLMSRAEDVEEEDHNPFEQPDSEGSELASREQDLDPFAAFATDESDLVSGLSSPPLKVPFPKEEQPNVHTSSTFMVDDDEDHQELPDYTEEDFAPSQNNYNDDNDYDDSSELEIDTVLTEPFSIGNDEDYGMEDIPEQDGVDYQDELEFDEIDSSFFDLEELEQGLPDTGLFNVVEDPSGASSTGIQSTNLASNLVAEADFSEPDEIAISEAIPNATKSSAKPKEDLEIEVKQGTLANFINAPIRQKQLTTAGVTGLVSAIAVLTIGLIGSGVVASRTDRTIKEGIPGSILLSLVAGLSSAGTAAAIGNITSKHITKTSQDLQNQFDDVYQGNLNAKATVYSQDEFGQLASGFNRMTRGLNHYPRSPKKSRRNRAGKRRFTTSSNSTPG
jgi:twitching motility protein PilJ